MPTILSCGCWSLSPKEIRRQELINRLAGYSDKPITVLQTCPRCMELRGRNIEEAMNLGHRQQLDFFL